MMFLIDSFIAGVILPISLYLYIRRYGTIEILQFVQGIELGSWGERIRYVVCYGLCVFPFRLYPFTLAVIARVCL